MVKCEEKKALRISRNWTFFLSMTLIILFMVIVIAVDFWVYFLDYSQNKVKLLEEEVASLERELIYAREHKDAWIKSFGRFYLYAEDWPMREEAAEKAILYSFYEFEDPNKEWSMQERRMWVGKTLVTFVDQKIFYFESFRFQDPDLGF